MKKHQNIWITILSVLLIFILGFSALFLPVAKMAIITTVSVLLLLLQILSYFINSGFLDIDNKEYKLKNPEEKPDQKTSAYFLEPVLTKILYPLQMIEAATNVLKSPVDQEKQLSAARLLENNIRELKKAIELDFYTADSFINEPETIPFELQTFTPSAEVIHNISVGIFKKNREDVLRLNLILQSYGFFTRIFSNEDEVMQALDANLIQLIIINPDHENDESFDLCARIRQKYDILTIPILVIVKKYMTFLIEKSYEQKCNTFITEPFDGSELVSKIQMLADAQAVFMENQQLLKSEKEKRAFLYFVTHDVNTPLTILLNEIYSLSNIEDFTTISSKEIHATIDNIQHSAEDIDVIIQNVLTSYKISDGRYLMNPKVINIDDFIQLQNMYLINKIENKNQTFNFVDENKNLRVFCDENSLKGIYRNLVDNAIKYAPLEGKIKVEITSDEKHVYLAVSDDGPGIPLDKQDQIFKRFANIGSKPTAQEKSVGLGLYVVNEICKLNDLELSYSDNKKEKSGSVFTVKFTRIGE